MIKYPLFLSIFMVLLTVTGCKKTNDNPTTITASHHNDTDSHNNGIDCQTCHKPEGSGKGIWVVAGSVYNQDQSTPNANGTIFFYDDPSGTGNISATIEVDGLGNFYTTASVMPPPGIYPQIRSATGTIKNMPFIITSGNCNGCHGVTTSRIWVN